MAKLCIWNGASVSLADVQVGILEEVFKALGSDTSKVLTTPVGVRDYSQVTTWIERTKLYFGRLDGAANIAGVIWKEMEKKRYQRNK